MSRLTTVEAEQKEAPTQSELVNTIQPDKFAPYQLADIAMQSSGIADNDSLKARKLLPEVELTQNRPALAPSRARMNAMSYEDFVPPLGTPANPTIGADASEKEADALLRHFNLIPNKVNSRYIDARALENYIRTNDNLTPEDRLHLTNASSHFNRIQQSSNDEWGRETSGITLKDIDLYPDQEYGFEYQFTKLAYAKNNFSDLAGPDGVISVNSLRTYGHRRIAEGAGRDEIALIAGIDRDMRVPGFAMLHDTLTRANIDARLRPAVMLNGRIYNYEDFARGY